MYRIDWHRDTLSIHLCGRNIYIYIYINLLIYLFIYLFIFILYIYRYISRSFDLRYSRVGIGALPPHWLPSFRGEWMHHSAYFRSHEFQLRPVACRCLAAIGWPSGVLKGILVNARMPVSRWKTIIGSRMQVRAGFWGEKQIPLGSTHWIPLLVVGGKFSPWQLPRPGWISLSMWQLWLLHLKSWHHMIDTVSPEATRNTSYLHIFAPMFTFGPRDHLRQPPGGGLQKAMVLPWCHHFPWYFHGLPKDWGQPWPHNCHPHWSPGAFPAATFPGHVVKGKYPRKRRRKQSKYRRFEIPLFPGHVVKGKYPRKRRRKRSKYRSFEIPLGDLTCSLTWGLKCATHMAVRCHVTGKWWSTVVTQVLGHCIWQTRQIRSSELMFHSFTLPLVAGSFLFVTKSGRGFILGCVIWRQPWGFGRVRKWFLGSVPLPVVPHKAAEEVSKIGNL